MTYVFVAVVATIVIPVADEREARTTTVGTSVDVGSGVILVVRATQQASRLF